MIIIIIIIILVLNAFQWTRIWSASALQSWTIWFNWKLDLVIAHTIHIEDLLCAQLD